MIKEIKKYEVDGKIFDTKLLAIEYINSQKNTEFLVISKFPDLTEGRHSFSKKEIFKIVVKNEDRLKTGQNSKTIEKLVENLLSQRYFKYEGIMGVIQLMENYMVEIKTHDEIKHMKKAFEGVNYIKISENPNEICLNDLPYDFREALRYLENIIFGE